MSRNKSESERDRSYNLGWPAFLAGACLVLILAGLVLPRRNEAPPAATEKQGLSQAQPPNDTAPGLKASARSGGLARDPEEVVATKLSQFATARLSVVQRIAEKHGTAVPADIARFFELAGSGNYAEAKVLFEALEKQRLGLSGVEGESFARLWPAVKEMFLVSSCAHDWPAQQLLDYGRSILDTLRPGMVYLGGTDPGRGIPALLSETSGGERTIVLTQNAFADARYLQYMDALYGDRLKTLTGEESQRAFQDYLADAQKRLDHDLQFPNEARQLRPGEDVKRQDNRVMVSGQVAVMAINERLLQTLISKNPDVGFALEESFPMKSTYPDAVPLGPIMELSAADAKTAYTPELAAQSAGRWNAVAETLRGNIDVPADSKVREAYAKLATTQAGLLADHGYSSQAEQAYRAAVDIAPTYPEAVFRYVNALVANQRPREAIPVLEAAVRGAPDNQMFRALLDKLKQPGGH